MKSIWKVAGLSLVVTVGCGRMEAEESPPMSANDLAFAGAPPPPPPAPPATEAMGSPEMPAAKAANAPRRMVEAKKAKAKDSPADAKEESIGGLAADEAGAPAAPGPVAPTRAWFPETFLFAPRVITDEHGSASLDVLVPDRLTTWRILALAHSRKGAQAGSVTTIASQLPVSIDLVVPAFLVAGDRVALPIQVMNTTDKAITRPLVATAEAGTLRGAPDSIRVDAQSTQTATAWLDAPAPGDIRVEASVGGDDKVSRSIPVESPGRPRHTERSGTLAAKRALMLPLEPAVLPGSAEVNLQVFPGALAILRSEIAASPARGALDDDGYLAALAGRARALSTKLGAPIDDATLARLGRIAGQRVARRALNPDLFAAMTLAPGALSFDADTLVARNGDHLAAFVARNQRADGTFAGGDGWPLSRVVVATAAGVNAVRAATSPEGQRRAAAATLRARGAFERFAGQIDDPWAAAVVLATGVVDGDVAKELQKKVIAAIVDRSDGMRALPVMPGAVRADGTTPTEVEATATAILALHDVPDASKLLPDLGATVISAYRPGVGFGDGATNRAALDAVALLFADPLPQKVSLSFTVNGKQIGQQVLEGDKLHSVVSITGPVTGSPDALTVAVEADPPLPGLSFVLGADYTVPWPKPDADAGLTLDVTVAGKLAVGHASTVELRANAPGGAALHLTQGLPAGVDAVRTSLDALVTAGTITHYDVTDGVLTIDAPGRHQGELFVAAYKVMPTLGGALHARVASVQLAGNPSTEVFFPPATWNIARE